MVDSQCEKNGAWSNGLPEYWMEPGAKATSGRVDSCLCIGSNDNRGLMNAYAPSRIQQIRLPSVAGHISWGSCPNAMKVGRAVLCAPLSLQLVSNFSDLRRL